MTKQELLNKLNLKEAHIAKEGDEAFFICTEIKNYKSKDGKAYCRYKGTALNKEGEEFSNNIEVMAPRFIFEEPLGCLFTIKLLKGEPKADPKTGQKIQYLNWTIDSFFLPTPKDNLSNNTHPKPNFLMKTLSEK